MHWPPVTRSQEKEREREEDVSACELGCKHWVMWSGKEHMHKPMSQLAAITNASNACM